MTSAPMDDNEDSIFDASDKMSNHRGNQQTRLKPQRPECLLFESAIDSTANLGSLAREPESNYALSKVRSLTEGVPSQQLSEVVNRAITRIRDIDADGFLFAGDPCTLGGHVSADANRQLCLIWVPGLGNQLLESIPHWVHVASSRLNQKLDHETDWFDAIRTIGVQSVGGHALLMTAVGTTADPFVCRIGKLFRVPVVRFEPMPTKLDRSWVTQQLNSTADSNALRRGTPLSAFFCWLDAPTAAQQPSKAGVAKPARGDADRLLASLATMSLLLLVRNGGNVLATSEQRLQIQPGNATRVLINPNLTKPKVTDRLLTAGAAGWWLADRQAKDQTDTPAACPPTFDLSDEQAEAARDPETIEFQEIKKQPFLIHWTRRRVGAWPDQTQDEYLDDLIFRSARRRHNEFAALCRILASRKILSSNQLTRDRRQVTCLSDMTLKEMISKRVFRSHLSRWDFEPYGIAFKRNVFLRQFGARPVIYGGEAEWQSLDEEQRPYFQMRKSQGNKIDWQEEKEWRVLGDVDLNQVGPNDAVVFVGRASEVAAVAELSIWPVVVLGE